VPTEIAIRTRVWQWMETLSRTLSSPGRTFTADSLHGYSTFFPD